MHINTPLDHLKFRTRIFHFIEFSNIKIFNSFLNVRKKTCEIFDRIKNKSFPNVFTFVVANKFSREISLPERKNNLKNDR